jgi:predicted ATP-dependent Lon-type protease
MLEIPNKADQRGLVAIRRLSEGFLKLLFPHVTGKDDMSTEDKE